MGYRVVKNHDKTLSRFDTVPACDRQMDRQTDVQPISITCFSIADARKKAQERYISHMWGEAPSKYNATKFGTVVDVLDVITHAKFYGENLRGSDFTGARILAFSIDFAYGP